MTQFLQWMLGRLPIGWLQLTHNKTRLIAAIGGVSFANILVLVQLGIMGSFNDSLRMSYEVIKGDVIISAHDSNTFLSGSNIPRQWGFRALSVPGVTAATPVFLGVAPWTQPNGSSIVFQVVGIDPTHSAFIGPNVPDTSVLQVADTAFIDRLTRDLNPELIANLSIDEPLTIEAVNRQMKIVGSMPIGLGFAGDGYLMLSDQSFMRLFPKRSLNAPDHILLSLDQNLEPQAVITALKKALPEEMLRIRTLDEAINEEISYQTTKRPTGLIFGFGVAIGIIVGVVIVYQVLSTDVADHMTEYATFKAMGYSQKFLLGIVFEEAVILALAGFLPGIVISTVIYSVLAKATNLPIEMSVGRGLMVLIGTIISCMISGFIATRRLASADPADLF